MVINQAYLFLIFIINGFIIGFVFDTFRILRISFKTKDFITYIEDILFWIITGAIVLYSIFVFNNGEIRFYIFLGIIIGVILYMTLFSKYIITISVGIIKIIKKVVGYILKIILFPVIIFKKIIKIILRRPISFITINMKKGLKKIKNKIQFIEKAQQKNAKIAK